MKIKITADSSCDLSQEYLKNNNIDIAKLSLIDQTTNKLYIDGELTNQELFKLMEENHQIKTSCPSPYDYQKLFEKHLKDYQYIIHLNMSSRMSGSYNVAKIASEVNQTRIKVIDSQNLTMALGLIINNLVDNIKKTNDLKEILNQLKKDINRTEMIVVLNTAKYALNGGRVRESGNLKSLVLEKLGVKPTIEMIDGFPEPLSIVEQKLFKGNVLKVATEQFRKKIQNMSLIDHSSIVLGTTEELSKLGEIKNNLNDLQYFKNILEFNGGSVISSHVGPKTYAMAYMRK